jgi:hypothetical protein
VHEGHGWLLRGEDEVACYAYRWVEGHEIKFLLAIAGTTASGHMRNGFAVVSCSQQGQDLHYSAVDPDQSPWEESDELGRPLTREEALDPAGAYPDLWELTDAIALYEPRLESRIVRQHEA